MVLVSKPLATPWVVTLVPTTTHITCLHVVALLVLAEVGFQQLNALAPRALAESITIIVLLVCHVPCIYVYICQAFNIYI
jgi:hypothetical protein